MSHNPFMLPKGPLPDPLPDPTRSLSESIVRDRESALSSQMKRFGWPETAEYVAEHMSARTEPVEGSLGMRTRYFHDGTPFLVETIWNTVGDHGLSISIEQKFEFLNAGEARS